MDPEEPTTATEKPQESPQDVPKGDDQDHHSDPEYDKGDNSQNGNQGSKRKEPANDPDLKARRVFVGNLSFKTHWQRVREHMRRAGNVIRVDIFSNKDGRSKGCGLVEYSTLAEADRAMNELNQTTLDDRQIFVRKDDVDMAKHDHEHYEKQTRPPASRDRNHSYGGQRSRYDRRDYYYRSKSRSRSPRRGDRRRYERSYSRDRSYSPRRSRSRSSQRYRDRRSRSRSYGRDDRYRSRGDDRNRGHSRSRSWRRSRSRSVERDNRDRDRDRDYRNMGRPQGSDRSDKEQRRGCQIIVKNIPWSVTWQQLKDAFKEYGPIIRAEVPQDNTGRSKGYGFVRFEREKDAQTAIDNMDRASFNGREITVKVCDN